MNSFNLFFDSLLKSAGISLIKNLTIDDIRLIISKVNEYLYTNYDGIGVTNILDTNFEYFSEFHKFWEKYHKEILSPEIDEKQCDKAADVLHNVLLTFGKDVFRELYNTYSLTSEQICKVRFFSANQDFRGSRDFKVLADKFSSDPSVFDKNIIFEIPEDFLKHIGITSLSQNDKRIKYAKTAAQILIDLKIEPYNLFEYFAKDVLKIRDYLSNQRGSGFGFKKIDIFIRDMILLNVWENPINFDKINVASDINTIKVALRSGILKTKIPLISSFMDIFCYQYGLIDEMNALAWRKVWEKWKLKHPENCIESPCLIDYFIYRIIGKEFCKETLYFFQCKSENHLFKWHSSHNQSCQLCYGKGKRSKAYIIKKVLPCTDKDGKISITKNNFVKDTNALLRGLEECPFITVCCPQSENFIKLNPPKSISILGQTGWDSARTRRNEGGGGLMS